MMKYRGGTGTIWITFILCLESKDRIELTFKRTTPRQLPQKDYHSSQNLRYYGPSHTTVRATILFFL